MANRRRLGVALLLDPPVATQVDGLRRAVGDPSLGRIAPHLTLVPPVNVRRDELPAALAVLRRAAAGHPGPVQLTLGAVATFLPANPVLYLSIGGDTAALRKLRDDVFQAPLERTLSWPWVPHVTLADGIEPSRIGAALEAMAGYAVVAVVDRVVLLEEGPGRVWEPLADVAFGPPARVGTGGLTVELVTSRLPDPELAGLELAGPERAGPELAGPEVAEPKRTRPGAEQAGPGAGSMLMAPIVITARREGQPVGQARAWVDRRGAGISVWVRSECRGQGIGGHLLAHLEAAARRAGWEFETLAAHGPAGFYRSRSRWAVPYANSTEA